MTVKHYPPSDTCDQTTSTVAKPATAKTTPEPTTAEPTTAEPTTAKHGLPAPKVGMVSLGCPKALVDSERILTQLRVEGYQVVPDYGQADVVIVNTCGFIDDAIAESMDSIGEALDENGQVIVTGCLGKNADILKAQFPELLAVTGPQAYSEVMDAVHQVLPKPSHNPFEHLIPPQGIKLTPRHYAYLKISEGCNHRCSFCIIPSLRGDLVSRPIGSVMAEAQQLAQAGVKELLIISQDTSAYGLDLKYKLDFHQGRALKTQLFDLCQALGELGIWVRLHYVYPYPHVDAIIPLMAQGNILPYLDIPLQHASTRILKAMKRPAYSDKTLKRIEQWRKVCPDITLRSTFIVGFPGETEDDFQQLLAFLAAAQLDRVGCFQYSPVNGASANELANPVPEEIKQQRFERFMELQAKISHTKLTQKIGQSIEVLIDEVNEHSIIGRSKADAPEIDGLVYLRPHPDRPKQNNSPKPSLTPGQWVTAQVTAADPYDLFADIID